MAAKERAGDGQSISRAIAVLRVVADAPGASLGEIAKATGFARSTVQRLVGALNNEGLLTKNPGQQGVFLGMELARLGARVDLDARTLLLPLMEELHAKIGENIDLTVLDGDRVIVIEQLASNEQIRVISYVGRQHPIHCTANGKAHLGQLPRAQALALLGADLERFTPNTITDPEALLRQIADFQTTGLYIDQEEFGEDACGIGIALPPIGGRNLAIAIALPKSRLARLEAQIEAALMEFRREIQTRFGLSI